MSIQPLDELEMQTFLAAMIIAIIAPKPLGPPALARDDGRFANSPLKPSLDTMSSHKELCPSFAEALKIEDADWGTKNGPYRRGQVGSPLRYRNVYCYLSPCNDFLS